MKIIYVFKKNPCVAIMAAHIHLKLDILRNCKDIKNIYNGEGHFYYLGIDEELNEIYLLHSKKPNAILKNLLKGLGHLYKEEVLIIGIENL